MKAPFFHSLWFVIALFSMVSALYGQGEAGEIIQIDDFNQWRNISQVQISPNGKYVCYAVEVGEKEGDGQVALYDAAKKETKFFERGAKPSITADNDWLVFTISPSIDSLKALRRKKVKKEELPKDTLALYQISTKILTKIGGVHKVAVPEKYGPWVAYQFDREVVNPDTAEKKPLIFKELVIKDLKGKKEWVIPETESFSWAKSQPAIIAHSKGRDSTFAAGIYFFSSDRDSIVCLKKEKGDYFELAIDDQGNQTAFSAYLDTLPNPAKPATLFFWEPSLDSAEAVVKADDTFLPDDWLVSRHGKLSFSEDGSRLLFGISPFPTLPDTTLLPEEVVHVEVWHSEDSRLYPHQNVEKERDQKKTFSCIYFPASRKTLQIGSKKWPDVRLLPKGKGDYSLLMNDDPYLKNLSWEGFPAYMDLAVMDLETGEQKEVAKKLRGRANLSADGNFIYWYSYPDSAWYTHQIRTEATKRIADKNTATFYDELNDRPMLAGPYGLAGWVENDASFLVYDRYDIWRLDPTGRQKPVNLTSQRTQKQTCRIMRLDKEQTFFKKDERLLVHIHNHKTRQDAYGWLDLGKNTFTAGSFEPHRLTTRPLKAKEANRYIFTQEDFNTFPDLRYTKDFKTSVQISNVNPQQEEYAWGSIELISWTGANGEKLEGLLVKPANFDPAKKYPMIVNFYERSSQRLFHHRAPFAHRSTINYSYYASRGYVIFNPDVHYRVGYPGESAFNAVTSGVSYIISLGFVDSERIGLQGHSWGGYQIAYLLTRTNMFKCAESGAPVVNMTSAYGGIRWRSGLSRMFQYEHTQSRIGGTLWEYPLRYVENSPLFTLDKVETPVLILHNDKDGAVPWYQGIEYFVGLRRLGKPAWLLNYSGEPHWPVKRQNRVDFQTRMSQFFDFYLQDAPKPIWMEKGVPALDKGIDQGLELIER